MGALLQQMIIDGQITEAQAETLVSTGLNGTPLNEDAQVYFYAGASGISFMDAAKMGDDLDIDGDTAYAAWRRGAELAEDIVTEIENGRFFYTPSVNSFLMANAESKVSENYEKAMSDWLKVVGGGSSDINLYYNFYFIKDC